MSEEAVETTIALAESDKYYNMIVNYITADEGNYETPETCLNKELNAILGKIESIERTILLVADKNIKAALAEKINAYKDSCEHLIEIAKKFNQFQSVIGVENG